MSTARAAAPRRGAYGHVFAEIGENLLAQGRGAGARPHFARTHAILSQDRSLDRPEEDQLARWLQLSR